MKIYYPYYYLFYRLARMNDILFPDYVNSDNFPIVGGISTLQMINTSSLLIILEYFIGYDFITRWSIIGAGLSFLIFNYFCLQWKGKDKIIYEMFKNESKRHRNIGIIFMWIYIVGTWIFFIYLVSLKKP